MLNLIISKEIRGKHAPWGVQGSDGERAGVPPHPPPMLGNPDSSHHYFGGAKNQAEFRGDQSFGLQEDFVQKVPKKRLEANTI